MSDERVQVATTVTDEGAEKIAELCRRLAGLLEDPHPGLMTWAAARNRVGCELRDALNEQLPEES